MFGFKTLVAFTLLNVSIVSFAQIQPGTQFITGACGDDSDCFSVCCGRNSGRCAGAVIAQSRDGGCGSGGPGPNSRAADSFFIAEAAQRARGVSSAAGNGRLSPNDPCISDADCATQCCGFTTGLCANPSATAQAGFCGFGENSPNDRSGDLFRAALAAKGGAAPPAQNNAAAAPPAQNNGGAPAPPAPAPGGSGTQFITGICTNDGDCASGCCGFTSGKCAGAIIALERDGGCGFGNPTSNDDAARRLRGRYVARELLYAH